MRVGESTNGLLDVAQTAEILGTSSRHLRRLVQERRIPFVKVGRYVRFMRPDISQWIAANRVESEAHVS